MIMSRASPCIAVCCWFPKIAGNSSTTVGYVLVYWLSFLSTTTTSAVPCQHVTWLWCLKKYIKIPTSSFFSQRTSNLFKFYPAREYTNRAYATTTLWLIEVFFLIKFPLSILCIFLHQLDDSQHPWHSKNKAPEAEVADQNNSLYILK